MKKALALFLALLMTFALAACATTTPSSGQEEPAPAPAPAAEKPESPAALSEGAKKLTVWCWDPAFNIYAMNEAAKVYQQQYPDFTLEVLETSWDDLQTKVTTAATSNQLDTLPDIILMQDNAYQKNVINYPDLMLDITGSGIDFSQFAAAKTAYSVVNGKNYGVPFDNGTVITALRTDVLEQAGYKIEDFTDTTWDNFIAKAEDVLAKTGKPLLSSVAGQPDLIMILLQSCGSSLFNTDGTPNIANNAELKEVLRVYQALVSKGILVEVNNWDEYIGTIVNETVAGTINGCWILASIQSAQDQAGKWAITNLPTLNTANATHYSNNGGSSWGIIANTKNKDLAIDFLKNTFAGSVPLYETILPSSGALATYLPAGASDVYAQPQAFFNGQPIYATITEYAGKVPSNITGVYYYEARDAVGVALAGIMSGTDAATALTEAESNVKFLMGQ